MPKLSPVRAAWPKEEGLVLLNRGKIRDNYGLGNSRRFIVASDGISARDYLVNALIKDKGIFLTALSVFWFNLLAQYGIKHHVIAYGAGIDAYLPEHLRNNPDRQSRSMVVMDLIVDKCEEVVRKHLTGSGLKDYLATGEVCGQKLPPGLQDGDELPMALFTPSTKAEKGHDENISAEEIIQRYPLGSMLSVQAFEIMYYYARQRGIIVADGKDETSGSILCDEFGTPDACRFWPLDEWRESRKADKRKAPSSFDKDPIRRWLDGEISKWEKEHGVVKMDPENPEHVDAVHTFVMPHDLIRETMDRNRYIFWLLAGKRIERFRREDMGVDIADLPPRNVAVVCGSESDWPLVSNVISLYGPDKLRITAHVLSCHRNPAKLAEFAAYGFGGSDAAVFVGGKAFALPGVADAQAYAAGKRIPAFGVALGEPGSKSWVAAQLSIEEIPGSPVITDHNGDAYQGAEGLEQVLDQIANGELPPPKARKEVPAQMNRWNNWQDGRLT